jgi:nitroimidazol reductase NimA-like FMN-containing flavoprotein (pyridoxamine 5'-phosphate oxidase superfamily)
MSTSRAPSDRTKVRRIADRGAYDRETIYSILDEALVSHVGIVQEGQPFVMPMLHARVGDNLYLHGSAGSRLMKRLAAKEPACVTATLLDALVVARSVFHHSLNYRSVVVLGQAAEILGREAKLAALEGLVERVIPGRSQDARGPNERELAATMIVRFPLQECSAKIRSGPPKDDEEDYALPIWAGVVPIRTKFEAPQCDGHVLPGVPPPQYLLSYNRPA